MPSKDIPIARILAYVALFALGALGMFMTLCGLVVWFPVMFTAHASSAVIISILIFLLGVGILTVAIILIRKLEPKRERPAYPRSSSDRD